jgi:hypothetical protein
MELVVRYWPLCSLAGEKKRKREGKEERGKASLYRIDGRLSVEHNGSHPKVVA